MKVKPNHPIFEASPQSQFGVLCLSPPPGLWKATEWYLSSIAGVPFLLRNILTLQRSGIHDVTIFMNAPEEEVEKLQLPIVEDSRINSKIRWVSKLEQLKETFQNRKGRILFFNGSALHDKKEVRSLLNDSIQEKTITSEILPICSDQLESFIKTIKMNGESTLPSGSNRNNEKERGKSLENGRSFLYISGSSKTKIQKPNDFNTQHERLLEGSGQNHDSAITRLLSRPISRKLTRLFLNMPIHPNQITLLSFALGLVSALCFFQGTYWMNILGGLLLLFSTWVDGADGEIARLKFMETELGSKLDIICDNIVHFFVFGAIGWGMHGATGDKIYIYLGGLAALGSLTAFILLYTFLLKKNANTQPTSPLLESRYSLIEKLSNRDFIHFLMLMALINLMDVFIFLAAVGANAFASYLIYSRFMEFRVAKSSKRS